MSLANEINGITKIIRDHLQEIENDLTCAMTAMDQAEEGIPDAFMEDLPGYAEHIIAAARGILERLAYLDGLHRGAWLENKRWNEEHRAKNNG